VSALGGQDDRSGRRLAAENMTEISALRPDWDVKDAWRNSTGGLFSRLISVTFRTCRRAA
jgi:hypothetical protein